MIILALQMPMLSALSKPRPFRSLCGLVSALIGLGGGDLGHSYA